MKNIFSTTIAMIMLSIAFVGCKDLAKENKIAKAEIIKTTQQATGKYIVNSAESTITWAGFKPTGTHTGTISISSGEFTVFDGKINSGSFTIDMTSITESKNSQRLIGHLKSPDFFNVVEFSSASFEVTGTNIAEGKTMLSGNLTIKNITKDVTFPITILNEDKSITLTSEVFEIDRTKWDIKYKSKTIFGDLGDKFINDGIELKIMVKANEN